MWTGTAGSLSAADHLPAQTHLRLTPLDSARTFQSSPGQDQEATELMLVEVSDRVDEVAVEPHLQATSRGANSRLRDRRSVRVHPSGGARRSP